MPDSLARFQERLGYSFNDESILRHALKHRSAGSNNNERLEFLGDSLIGLFAAEILFKAYPEAPEGDLSSMRSHLVRKESLAEIARLLRLEEVIELGQSALSSGGHRRDSILADAVEAVIAATYLDGGWQNAAQVSAKLLQAPISAIEDVDSVRDSKSLLQEWLQARGKPVPSYQTIEVSGPGHARQFAIACRVTGHSEDFVGEGPNRRAAEQKAAQQALTALENSA